MSAFIRTVKIALAAIAPDDVNERMLTEPVRELAASIKSEGLLNLPVIQTGTNKLIAGGDRIAALMLNEETSCQAREFSGTKREYLRMQIAENRFRREASVKERAAMLAEYMGEVQPENDTNASDEKPNDSTIPRPGATGNPNPKKESTKRLEKAAEEIGITTKAAKRVLERAAKKEKRKAVPSDAPDLTVPLLEGVIELNGIVIAPHLATAIKILHENLRAMEVGTTVLLSRLTSTGKAIAGQKAEKRNWDQFGTLRAAIKEAAGQVRHLIPAQACPYPKAGKDHEDCPACKGTMYLTAAQGTNVPREIAPAKAKPKAGPTVSKLTGKKIKVVGEDDEELAF